MILSKYSLISGNPQTALQTIKVTTEWQRVTAENFDCTSTADGYNTGFYLTTSGRSVGDWIEVTGCQLEYGPSCTSYQQTDGTLLSSDTYGIFSNAVYIGNTAQNPVFKFESTNNILQITGSTYISGNIILGNSQKIVF